MSRYSSAPVPLEPVGDGVEYGAARPPRGRRSPARSRSGRDRRRRSGRARRGARAARTPRAAATSSARRLLPAPPGPVIVTSRALGRGGSRHARGLVTPDEPVVQRRQARRRERLERREVLAEIGSDELEELRRGRDVLQPVSSERSKRGTRRAARRHRRRASPARRRPARRAPTRRCARRRRRRCRRTPRRRARARPCARRSAVDEPRRPAMARRRASAESRGGRDCVSGT